MGAECPLTEELAKKIAEVSASTAYLDPNSDDGTVFRKLMFLKDAKENVEKNSSLSSNMELNGLNNTLKNIDALIEYGYTHTLEPIINSMYSREYISSATCDKIRKQISNYYINNEINASHPQCTIL